MSALKSPDVRARQNKSTTRATLTTREGDIEIPLLPPRLVRTVNADGKVQMVEKSWNPLTLSWWNDIWPSPMAAEWHSSDVHGLIALAMLYDNFFDNPTPQHHSELRLARQPYGLTPLDRRRLEWTVENTEKVREEGEQRRQAATIAPPTPAGDQDKRLHVV